MAFDQGLRHHVYGRTAEHGRPPRYRFGDVVLGLAGTVEQTLFADGFDRGELNWSSESP